MNIEYVNRKLIEKHFDGTLDEAGKMELERLLAESAEVRAAFDNMAFAVRCIQIEGFNRMIKGFHRELFPDDTLAADNERKNRHEPDVDPPFVGKVKREVSDESAGIEQENH